MPLVGAKYSIFAFFLLVEILGLRPRTHARGKIRTHARTINFIFRHLEPYGFGTGRQYAPYSAYSINKY